MGHIARKTLFVLASLSLASALGACGQIAAHRGAIIDPVLSTTLAPGVDNRESVQRLLGRPTFVG
ncbi:MAG: outer membrane protein assembly factor BamE, partial [Sphingomonadales bacterium]|nr:outer membrane protein assembly factor BamE [Sphingomonadales bacterium]